MSSQREEKIGYNVLVTGQGPGTTTAFYALTGCETPNDTWHCWFVKICGAPQNPITCIFVPGVRNWFWRRLICIMWYVYIYILYIYIYNIYFPTSLSGVLVFRLDPAGATARLRLRLLLRRLLLTHSLTHPPSHPPSHPPTHRTHSLTHSLPTRSLTHSLTSLTHPPTHSLSHSVTQSLTLTHSLTHSLTTSHLSLIIHHSSHLTHHSPLFTTPLVTSHSSFTLFTTPLITSHSSFTTLHYTTYHISLIIHHSSLHYSSHLTLAWQAQYTELPGGAAARVAAAGPQLPFNGRRSTQSFLAELRRA